MTTQITAYSNAPLLKWPGGKRGLAKFILSLVPAEFGAYYEPFLGSAALFFAMRPPRAFLSDNNSDLISTYVQVRDNPDGIIRKLRTMRNSERHYYAVRSSVPRSELGRAARLIYLSTLSFNGIHRVNLKGSFNVPYGYKTHLRPCDPARIYAASETLRTASITCDDFETAVAGAASGDLIYLDPPYTTAHANNGFVKYNAKIFTWEDQKRLAALCCELSRRGCFVIISNADHPSLRALYRDFRTVRVDRYSVIAASRQFRRRITECLFHNSERPDVEQIGFC